MWFEAQYHPCDRRYQNAARELAPFPEADRQGRKCLTKLPMSARP